MTKSYPVGANTVNELLASAYSRVKDAPVNWEQAQTYKNEIEIIASLCRDLGFVDIDVYRTINARLGNFEVISHKSYEPPLIQIETDQQIHGNRSVIDFAFAIEAAAVIQEAAGSMPDRAFGWSCEEWLVQAASRAKISTSIPSQVADRLKVIIEELSQYPRLSLRSPTDQTNTVAKYFKPFILEVFSLVNPARQIDIVNLLILTIKTQLRTRKAYLEPNDILSNFEMAISKIEALDEAGLVAPGPGDGWRIKEQLKFERAVFVDEALSRIIFEAQRADPEIANEPDPNAVKSNPASSIILDGVPEAGRFEAGCPRPSGRNSPGPKTTRSVPTPTQGKPSTAAKI